MNRMEDSTIESEAKQLLRKNGPLNGEEMNYKRFDNINTFCPKTHYAASKGSSRHKRFSSKRTVYYLDTHDKKDVVEKWTESNEDVFKYKSEWGLHLRICNEYPQFKQASRDVLGPFSPGSADKDNSHNKKCDLCGKELTGPLATHLPKCPER